jgi:uncharacterized membrane protein
MKKCSYCGTEHPDDAIVCAIDQTSLDKSHIAAVASTTKRKIPIRLSIVSYCFFGSGICYLGWVVIYAHHGRFLPLNLIVGVINLLVSIGLRQYSSRWRICALVLIWLAFFENCFNFVQSIRHSSHKMNTIVILIVWPLSFFILAWFYRALTRPDIREMFYKKS